MNSKEFNQELHIIDKRASILDALNMMNAITDGVMTLIVTKENGIVDGTVTDGDIRRAFLKGATLESTIARAANRNFCSIGPEGVCSGYSILPASIQCCRFRLSLWPEEKGNACAL